MIYFQNMGVILGVLLTLGAFWIYFFPEAYQKIAMRFIPEKRPAWFSYTAFLTIAWVGYTWFRFASFQNAISFSISLLMTLSLIKMYMILFKYVEFRHFVQEFVASTTLLKFFAIMYFALAIMLVGMGLAL